MVSSSPALPANKSSRPTFNGGIRGKSYLEEHQQYRPPHQDGYQGIDSIVESLHIGKALPADTPSRYPGVPSTGSSPRVVDSGVKHTMSHAHCQPSPGSRSDRIVATLFYKHNNPRASNSVPSPSASRENVSTSTSSSRPPIPAGLAPVRSLSAFPLEPPTTSAEPEPLDHLYGSYISDLCLASFLDLVASLPLPKSTRGITSSHRCLDTPHHPLVVELTFSPSPDPAYLSLEELRRHELLYRFEREWNVDVTLQYDTPFRRYPRLVVFDMDSTLIQQEVIDLLAASIGVEAQVSKITERAMNGELDFSASLKERVALLKGVDADIFTQLRTVVTPTPGARELIKVLKRLGCRTAVLSGGFIPLTSWLAVELGIDYAHANVLVGEASPTTPGTVQLSGELDPSAPIINAEAKARLLREIADKEGVQLNQVLAIGDGANDLLMMREAALGVAWRAKPVVQMQAGARLNGDTLLEVLYLMGFTKEEIDALAA